MYEHDIRWEPMRIEWENGYQKQKRENEPRKNWEEPKKGCRI